MQWGVLTNMFLGFFLTIPSPDHINNRWSKSSLSICRWFSFFKFQVFYLNFVLHYLLYQFVKLNKKLRIMQNISLVKKCCKWNWYILNLKQFTNLTIILFLVLFRLHLNVTCIKLYICKPIFYRFWPPL